MFSPWELASHPPPRNANIVEPYTFVTLFPGPFDSTPHRRYVTLEWPLRQHIMILGFQIIPYKNRRTGRGGKGGSCPPPIRAVCRHTFGQRGDIIRAKHNTFMNNTNSGTVTAVVNGKSSASTPPPLPNLARKISATTPPHWIWIPENFCYYPPPHWIHSGKTRSAPPPPNGCWPVRLCILVQDPCPCAFARWMGTGHLITKVEWLHTWQRTSLRKCNEIISLLDNNKMLPCKIKCICPLNG